MKDGKSETLSSDSSPKIETETVNEFEMRAATTPQGEWIETTPEIIMAITRGKGFGAVDGIPAKHICYKNVLVCIKGTKDDIINAMNQPMNDRLHGPGEARVVVGN